jgi:hypothetical protein
VYQCLDGFSAEIERRCVEKVVIDVGEHARRRLERMVGDFERRLFASVLEGRETRQDGRDVEDDGGFLECEGVLRGRLVGEGVEPVAMEGSASCNIPRGSMRTHCAGLLTM